MNRLPFDELDLKSRCANDTYRAARRLLNRAQIEAYRPSPNIFTGSVTTSDTTAVGGFNISTDATNYWCSCGHEHRFCEHLIAIGLAFLDSIHHQTALASDPIIAPSLSPERYALGLDVAATTISLFFVDTQTGHPLSDAWFSVISLTQLLNNWPYPHQKKLLTYLHKTHNDDFFNPTTYTDIATIQQLSRDALVETTILCTNGNPIKIETDEVDYQLSFYQDNDFIKLDTQWTKGNDILPISSPTLVACNTPFLIYQSTIYFLKNPAITPIVPVMEKQHNLKFDIKTFNYFKQNQIPSLKAKGLNIAIAPGLTNATPTPMSPTCRLYYRLVGDTLFVRPSFGYHERAVSIRQSHPFIFTNNQWIKRDLAAEKDAIKWLKSHNFTSTKHLFSLHGDKLYDFLKKKDKLTGPFQFKNMQCLERFTILKPSAKHKISIQKTPRSYIFKANLSLTHPAVEISPEKLKTAIETKRRYLTDGTTIIPIRTADSLSSFHHLPLKIVKNKIEIQLNLGQINALFTQWPTLITIPFDVSTLLSSLDKIDTIPADKTSSPIWSKLYPYQKIGVHWLHTLYKYQIGGILADEMGLGKTIQTLCFIHDIVRTKAPPNPILVIMPTTAVFNWAKEIQAFCPDLNVLIYEGQNRDPLRDKIPGCDIMLSSYAIIRRDAKQLADIQFDTIILDEAQAIKNYTSKTSQAICSLTADHRLAITGTPIENYVQEIWSIFRFLMPQFLGSYDSFKSTYEHPIKQHDTSALEQLKATINPFVLRRIKTQISIDLPPKKESILYADLSDDQKQLYQDIVAQNRQMISQRIEDLGFPKARFHIFSLLTKLRQICCHPALLDEKYAHMTSAKFELLKHRVCEVCHNNHKIVIFTQFIGMVKLIETALTQSKVSFVALTGQTQNRQQVVEKFDSDPTIQVCLMSLKAGGVGINLTAADYVFHFDPWWNPAVENQASDRIHRIGQDKPVFIYKMISQGTIEEKICDIQNEKRVLYDKVLNPHGIQTTPFLQSELDHLLDFKFDQMPTA